MKLTEDQITVLRVVLSKAYFEQIIGAWSTSHDRNLVLDELLRLCSKLNITVSKQQKAVFRIYAGQGKK